jgi:hypothetical protein
METTKLKLATALTPIAESLAKRAEAGEFSDFESPHPTPKIVLVGELGKMFRNASNPKRAKLAHELALDIINGKYDETKEEAEAWFEREGKDLVKKMDSEKEK